MNLELLRAAGEVAVLQEIIARRMGNCLRVRKGRLWCRPGHLANCRYSTVKVAEAERPEAVEQVRR